MLKFFYLVSLITCICISSAAQSTKDKKNIISKMCIKITKKEYDNSLKSVATQIKKSYQKSDPFVTLIFESNTALPSDSVLIIESNKIKDFVYSGSFKKHLKLSFTNKLQVDGPEDTISIFILSRTNLISCRWTNESSSAIWIPHKTFKIQLLSEADQDSDKLIRQFIFEELK